MRGLPEAPLVSRLIFVAFPHRVWLLREWRLVMTKDSPFFTNLKCRECGRLYPKIATHICEYDFGPLEAAYDYEAIGRELTREKIQSRPQSMWRYRELLPV